MKESIDGDTSASEETEQTRRTQGVTCPCCIFATSDLFLPERERITETTQTVMDDSSPMLPIACWKALKTDRKDHERAIPLVVDTHGHAHLDRETSERYNLGVPSSPEDIVSLTCAVEQSDWKACLEYAAQSHHRMAAIGIHPWYLADLTESWLEDLETLITEHPGCMVGEIGLCKMARFVRSYEGGKQAALLIQRQVFTKQLRLAAKYQRPVSIHCVNQQGVLMAVLKEEQNRLPPALALHSFSGTAHQIRELLKWEASLKLPSPLLYFGFSDSINNVMSTSEKARRQGREAIRQVPPDRLLSESDVHSDLDSLAGTAGAVSYLAWALEEPLEVIANRTRQNGLRFLQRLNMNNSIARQDLDENGQNSALAAPDEKQLKDYVEPVNEQAQVYKNRKPTWWIKKCKKASKAQRRIMREMQDYTLDKVPYGQLLDWSTVFSSTDDFDVWLEIGFGSGENLMRLAEQYHGTSKRFVGSEIYAPGAGKVYQRIQESIQKQRFWKGYTLYSPTIDPFCSDENADATVSQADNTEGTPESPYSNLRINGGDGIKLLPFIPDQSLAVVLITNPDPFPKQQYEWRIIQTFTLREIHRVLRKNGRLYLTTDDKDFYEWSLRTVATVNEDGELFRAVEPCPKRHEWLPVVSAYELRGWENGRRANLACWHAV